MNDAQQMAIEWACEKLCRQMGSLSDSNDFEALSRLFTEDAIYTRPSQPDVEIVGRAAILQAYQMRPPLTLRHLVTNCIIDVQSSDSATGHSYITFLGAPLSDAPLPVVAGAMLFGEFRDRFVRTVNGWQIAERRGRLLLKTA